MPKLIPGKLYIVGSVLTLRSDRTGNASARLLQIPYDAPVMFVEESSENNSWVKVIYKDTIGWTWGGLFRPLRKNQEQDNGGS